ncbi:MAG: PKD domain-containing protein [Bacteroidetes bacterium]|nr:PKD domain-containing protein [Bacteroidota bacterium]
MNGGVVGSNGSPGPACILGYSSYYVDNQGGSTIEFDGFTVPLTAMAIVIPCQTYHLRIAVADAGDPAYDSAVFLETGSLSTTPTVYAGADQSVCGNAAINLGISPVTGWTYSWSPSTGLSNPTISNPIATVSNSGGSPVVYTYVTTASNGTCVMSDTVNITVVPGPASNFSVISPICAGQTSTLTYLGSSDTTATYQWNFPVGSAVNGSGRGPIQVTYNSPGVYNIGLAVIDNGCPSTITTNTIHVHPQPIVNISTPSAICAGDTISLATTGSAVGPNANYSWMYSSGVLIGASGNDSITLQLSSPGNVNVSVVVQDSGCTSIQSNAIVPVNALPVANVVPPATQCSGSVDTVTFQGTTLAGTTYTWDFGSAQVLSGSGSGPYVVQWNNSGDFPVEVTVTSNNCVTSDSDNVHVDLQPQASFVAMPSVCETENSILQFDGVSDSLTQYHWMLTGNSQVSPSGAGPFSLNWSAAGNYPLQLITSNNACADTIRDTMDVFAKPVANFSVTPVCVYDSLTVMNASAFPDSLGGTYAWDFGDSYSSGSAQPSHLYSSFGNYTVSLILIAANGCSDSLQQQTSLYAKPLSVPSVDTVCFGSNSTFIANSSIGQGNISSWQWEVDSALHFSSSAFLTVLQSSGSHLAQLITTSDHGCTDTSSVEAYVRQTPQPDFLPDFREGCTPLLVSFTDLSSSPDDAIHSWHWTYSDGGVDTLPMPEHLFVNPDLYSVNLHVVTDHGCVADTFMNQLINVHSLPAADFAFNPSPADIIMPTVFFNDLSTPVIQWWWDFGDEGFSNDENPQHTYAEAGTYTVQLIVSNSFGCLDTTYREVVIDDAYTIWAPNAFTPNGDGKNDEFNVKTTGITDFKMVIFSRWGMEIFQTNNLYEGWDGRMNGGKAVEDTYVYRIVAKDRKQNEHVLVGHVTLYY